MKKEKIALTIVLLSTIVGGALAYKASRGETTIVYIQKTIQGIIYCSVPTVLQNATVEPIGFPFNTVASLNPNTLPGTCPFLTLYSYL
ncbi:hypothetical protein MRBLMN1_004596 [Chitinophaga ginsengisegetis]|uniref:hypothetical protein n=1 Tax=Chitinophaga ginsengisegetis TaxID=393003 RepID=UPI003437E38B